MSTAPLTQDVAIPDFLQCNACGRQWSLDDRESADMWEPQEAAEIMLDGGYGNRHWGDLTRIRFHACQDCIAAWIRTFQVAPEAWEIALALGGSPRPTEFRLSPFPAPPQEESPEPAPEEELFFEFGEDGA